MEVIVTEDSPPVVADTDTAQAPESAEEFQKFIYELFDKNGILNDLRAYLRGHVVNVLKSAQTGDPPPSQKHFTQRLELTFQALNILIAEYLLRLEFGYSLSVFVSEIPLANMVFAFAKTLMADIEGYNEDLKFKDSDVWCILNYLGVKCDSEHASNIVEMYKSQENTPLLLCMLKCMPLYTAHIIEDQVNSSDESVTSSIMSSDTIEEKHAKSTQRNSFHDVCKHYSFCKTCQRKISKVKEKYRRKKKNLVKTVNEVSLNPLKVESLLKNVSVLERSLIDEMFQQLKTVYEAEVEMIREDEEKTIKRSLASHALQLQKKSEEMEESFKAREQELVRNVQQKKKFLWGLARTLRDQHDHMMRAMHDVKVETKRLTDKEDSLKSQLADAEQFLKQRGEEMRTQISSELLVLEDHLESMKNERDNINRQRLELEQLKNVTESSSKVLKVHNMDSEDVKSHYDLLKNELLILKKYLEATQLQPKCVIERSTITELKDVSSRLSVCLNNSRVEFVKGDDKLRSNQVINDLKKQKNVNFSQSNLDEIYRERNRDRSPESSEAGDVNNVKVDDHMIQCLNEENERLKTFARQQREHIDDLLSQQARLQAELTASRFTTAAENMPAWRPRTAPTVMPQQGYYVGEVNTSASVNRINLGWRKGAGEELSLFSNAQPRILVPGDAVPFIGVLRDSRRNDSRRHLISQWRMLRRRVSPVAVRRIHSPVQRDRNISRDRPNSAGCDEKTPVRIQDETFTQNIHHCSDLQIPETMPIPQEMPRTSLTPDVNRNREKSPKSVLREAKQNLKNKSAIKDLQPPLSREKSPNSVLREAKLRLRKLEIEAEAVEQSYMDFKRRQSKLKDERRISLLQREDVVTKNIVADIDVKKSRSHQNLADRQRTEISKDPQQSPKLDFEKYLKEYKAKFDIGETHFKNRNTAAVRAKPIPESSKDVIDVKNTRNYLETPLTEFRKLYQSSSISPQRRIEKSEENRLKSSKVTIPLASVDASDDSVSSHKDARRKAKHKKAEFEILKQNINKMYNLEESIIDKSKENQSPVIVRNMEISKSNKNEIDLISNDDKIDMPNENIDNNVLRVEVENVSEVSNLIDDTENQGMLLVVESSIDNREVVQAESDVDNIRTQMAILICPKSPKTANSEHSRPSRPSVSPEKAAQLTRNDVLNSIFHTDGNNISSTHTNLELSNDGIQESVSDHTNLELSNDGIQESVSDIGKGEDYRDDFSADVDNYNSRSDVGSPISIIKTSEDENFWE